MRGCVLVVTMLLLNYNNYILLLLSMIKCKTVHRIQARYLSSIKCYLHRFFFLRPQLLLSCACNYYCYRTGIPTSITQNYNHRRRILKLRHTQETVKGQSSLLYWRLASSSCPPADCAQVSCYLQNRYARCPHRGPTPSTNPASTF